MSGRLVGVSAAFLVVLALLALSAGLDAAARITDTPNLIKNGGFESGGAYWIYDGTGGPYFSTEVVHSGSYSLVLGLGAKVIGNDLVEFVA